jgi:hypothetical protein
VNAPFSCPKISLSSSVRDQHRGRRRRGLLHDLVDLPHLWAGADHASEGAAIAQLTPQRLHLTQRVLALGRFVEQNAKTLRIDRLGEIVVRAVANRFDR